MPPPSTRPWRMFLTDYKRRTGLRCVGVRFLPKLCPGTRADFRAEYAARMLKRPVELREVGNGAFTVRDPSTLALLAYLFEYKEE